MYSYKIRHKNKKIDNYAGMLTFNPIEENIVLPKKILANNKNQINNLINNQ